MPATITSPIRSDPLKRPEGSGVRQKKPSRSKPRSVSTLTPAQLERKRAADREAQRIFRQRMKEHIENLEKQITELSEYKEQLYEALQQNAALRTQNQQLSQKFASITQQRQHKGSHTVKYMTEATAIPFRSRTHQETAFDSRQYMPMGQGCSVFSSSAEIPSVVGMPWNSSWNAYTPGLGFPTCSEYTTG